MVGKGSAKLRYYLGRETLCSDCVPVIVPRDR